MRRLATAWESLTGVLNRIGDWIAPLALRIVLGWEFYESGRVKFRGENWFGQVMDRFPWPFSVVPTDVSWFVATWIELIGAICLVIGLFTRFWAFSLMILTVVAIAGVHWPENYDSLSELLQGYVITDQGFGNYKLPLIYLVMFLPLLLNGAGRVSLDHLIHQRLHH